MPRFKIVGIDKHYLCDYKTRLAGFRLGGVIGTVDPFVDGKFMPDCLKVFLDDKDMVISGKEDDFFKAELEWGKSQVGKYLVCDDLAYSAFATHGNVSVEA